MQIHTGDLQLNISAAELLCKEILTNESLVVPVDIPVIGKIQPPKPSKTHQKKWRKVMRTLSATVLKRKRLEAMLGVHVDTPLTDLVDRTDIVETLRNLPQPEQRTDAWYMRREEMITASDFGHALKSDASRKRLAKTKAEPLVGRRLALIKNELYVRPERRTGGAACAHGVMFEPVCDLIYRNLCRPHAVTEEFGLLPHPSIPFLGASPDGICNAESPDALVGRLVEYKAPYSRKIVKGHVPTEYLAQMQGQLAVTTLDMCDYLECELKTDTLENIRTSLRSASPPIAYGFIVVVPRVDGGHSYLYGPYNSLSDDDVLACVEKYDQYVPDEAILHYWYLNDYQLVNVRRNEEWWENVLLPFLTATWDMVQANVSDALEKNQLLLEAIDSLKEVEISGT